MSTNFVKQLAALQVATLGLLAAETGNYGPAPQVLYLLNAQDREILGWTALGLIAEQQGDMVSPLDILGAARLWAVSGAETLDFADDYANLLGL